MSGLVVYTLWTLLLVFIFFYSFYLVGQVTLRLDEKKEWKHSVFSPFRIQVLYGFLLPLAVLGSFFVFHELLREGTVNSQYFFDDIISATVFLYIVNVYHFMLFKFKRVITVEHFPNNKKAVVNSLPLKKLPISLDDIALIYKKQEVVWLVDFQDGKHLTDIPLKEYDLMLNADKFFRINRFEIVHRDSIRKMASGTFGKISLSLNVSHGEGTVSKDRASAFRKWFRQ